ncbi:MAG: FtsX-like permease family protein [Planctomycetaceae bacterium]|nr:FtsX-like permease family protein [Planctomycetaceae bacterium]
MIPRAYFWNTLRLRPIRTCLSLISVAGAVAAVMAVLQSTIATRMQMNDLHSTLDSPVNMEIIATDTGPFAQDDIAAVMKSDEYVAVPIFRVFTKVVAGSRASRCLTVGMNSDDYGRVHDVQIVSGRTATEFGEVCLAASVAEHLRVGPGDEVEIGAKGLPWLLKKKVVGVYQVPVTEQVNDSATVLTTLDDAARLGKSRGKVNAVLIRLTGDRSEWREQSVRESVQAQLPKSLMVTQSAAASDLSRPTEAMIGVGLNVAAILSVIASVFIVFNSSQMSVTERQGQLAVMRIIGATDDQIRSMLYREALLIGLAGTVLGILPGIAGSAFLEQGMRDVLGFRKMQSVALQPLSVIVGIAFGPLVTMISIWFPAKTACVTPPMQVLKGGSVGKPILTRRLTLTLGVAFFIIASVFFALTWLKIAPWVTSIVAIACLEIASVLLLPELIAPMAVLYFRIAGWFAPIEAGLGHRQLIDKFQRTIVTVAVLFVVSATSICVGITTFSVTQNIESWVERTVDADFILFATRPSADMSDATSLPLELKDEIRQLPGITMVDEVSFCFASVNERSAMLAVQEFDLHRTIPIDLIQGDMSTLQDRLQEGEVLLGSVLANLLQVGLDDTVTIQVGESVDTAKVAGIVREYTAGGLMMQMDSRPAKERFPIPDPQVYGINSRPEDAASVAESLKTIAGQHGLVYQSLADLKNMIRSMVEAITSRLFLILVLALVIAAFAIVNSLTMNVIEQTRYLGLLRVVGLLQSQAFRLFLCQAVFLGAMGIIPGVLIGTVMSYLTTNSFGGITDHGVTFVAAPELLAGYVVCGVVLSLLAAVLPATRAARLRPLEAIHEE